MSLGALFGGNTVAHRRGVWRTLRCRLDRLYLHALRHFIGFDSWHANAPFSCRPYKKVVVDIVNSLRPGAVVEVGCGLGDILSRVNARERFGFDTDAAVIRAARVMHPGRVNWISGDASLIETMIPPGRRIDCLIMVNWIHTLSPDQLAECVLPILPRVGYLLVDSVDADALSSNRYRHDFQFMRGISEQISSTRVTGEPRELVLFKVA